MIDPLDRPVVVGAVKLLEENIETVGAAQVMAAARLAYMQGYEDAHEAEAPVKPRKS